MTSESFIEHPQANDAAGVVERVPVLDLKLEWTNRFHQLGDEFYSPVRIAPLEQAHWVSNNPKGWADVLGEPLHCDEQLLLQCFNGQAYLAGSQLISTVYSGHQFGVFAGQLGDGRAMMLGEIKTNTGFTELQLKGCGETPYSRMGDGRAVLRSSIREYLASEAMHGLGIATTRALSLVGSNEPVYRETVERGALVLRSAESFLRFGHFEHFYYYNKPSELNDLIAFAVQQYFPQFDCSKEGLENWFSQVVQSTAQLMAQWQSVGFNHGVMNTDNMSLLGLTLDYGPYGFLDAYNPEHICNHSDHAGRYRFSQQPAIGYWNCSAFAQSLIDVLGKETLVSLLKQEYWSTFNQYYYQLMVAKLGLDDFLAENQDKCITLVDTLLSLMAVCKTDYTSFFRGFSTHTLEQLPLLAPLFFVADEDAYKKWVAEYAAVVTDDTSRCEQLKQINPKYVLRNYVAQWAIENAEQGHYQPVNDLLMILQSPYDEHSGFEQWAAPPPKDMPAICVSCSS